jgi:processive 1,2-diacylglycerol beta-glucosyltransferase
MAVKSILILTAGFGEGHNAAARNLLQAINQRHPDVSATVVDAFDDAYGIVNRLAQSNYLWLINHAPSMWSLVFRWLDRTPVVAKKIGIFGRAAKVLAKIIEEKKPDVIVSTYPGYNHLLDHLHRKQSGRSFTQVTVVTDSITINSVWLSGHSDWLLVCNSETRDVIRNMGFPVGKIVVSGFPVPPAFSELRKPKAPPAPGEKWKVLFMVNSGKRIAADVLKAISSVPDIEITLTVGRDEGLLCRLKQTASAAGVKAQFFGWTDQMPRLIAESHVVISKAGGATVQECLAATSPMLISQVVPGQEEGNAQLIADHGAGVIAESPAEIVRALQEGFANGGALWSEWYRVTRAFSQPAASDQIADWIMTLRTPSKT